MSDTDTIARMSHASRFNTGAALLGTAKSGLAGLLTKGRDAEGSAVAGGFGSRAAKRSAGPSWKETWAFPAYSGLPEIV